MNNQSYEEYMREVLGYNASPKNTYIRTEDCYNMNIPMNNMMTMPLQIDNHMIKEGMAKKSNKSWKRKIPPILLKNKNIQIERITFPVEKGLKRTGETYFKKNVNEIFNELSTRKKSS